MMFGILELEYKNGVIFGIGWCVEFFGVFVIVCMFVIFGWWLYVIWNMVDIYIF